MDMVRDLLMLKAESGVRETNAYGCSPHTRG
nr:MAG TPA: hypothetical protein [Caudoviricetes sp.]